MSPLRHNKDCDSTRGREFATTHWSVVLSARGGATTEASVSLEKLCQSYWYPLYAFARRQGYSPHDAQDLTQGFFAVLLEKNYLGSVDRAKGRFRSFLLVSFKHFLANEWDRGRALKRGGGRMFVPLEVETAEKRYAHEPVERLTPEKLFERRWALTLLDQVLNNMGREYEAEGKAALFEQLKPALTGDRVLPAYTALAAVLGISVSGVKVAVHRLRKRYRDLLRSEIANTVAGPDEIDDELRCLFAALS